jgi:hypothetical protein
MKFAKHAIFALALLLAGLVVGEAQITIPYSFSAGQSISSSQVNANFTAVAGALNRAGGTMTGDLLFTDASFDIGKSGATRPRDIFASRNGVFGGTFGVTGATTLSSTLAVTGTSAFTGAITPASAALVTTTSTGTQNDFAPSITFSPGVVSTLRCNNASLLTISGITGGADGAILRVITVGAGDVAITDQDAGSTAANRFMSDGAVTLLLAAGSRGAIAEFIYDGTTARWRCIRHDQGGFIDFATSNSLGTTSTVVGWSSLTKVINFKKVGRLVYLSVQLDGTSNNATTTFTLPYASTFTGQVRNGGGLVQNTGGTAVGPCEFLMTSSPSSTVTMASDAAGSAFAGSGSKRCYGEFWYPL